MDDFPNVAGASFRFYSVYDGHGSTDYCAEVWWNVSGYYSFGENRVAHQEGCKKEFKGRDGAIVFEQAWKKYLEVR